MDYRTLLRLRHHLGIKNYISSYTPWMVEVKAGKSGQLFFLSSDSRVLIKTLTYSEVHVLRRILPQYFLSVTRGQNFHIMPKFLGLSSVQLPGMASRKIYVVVMQNILFPPHLKTPPRTDEVYDLKGSTFGRVNFLSEEESVVMKDMNCKRMIRVGAATRRRLMKWLCSSSTFLAQHNLLDYSLLLGVRVDSKRSSSFGGMLSGCFSEQGNDGANEDESDAEMHGKLAGGGTLLEAVLRRAESEHSALLGKTVDVSITRRHRVCRPTEEHTVYEIVVSVQGGKKKWRVYRRYSQFVELRGELNTMLGMASAQSLPPLPRKHALDAKRRSSNKTSGRVASVACKHGCGESIRHHDALPLSDADLPPVGFMVVSVENLLLPIEANTQTDERSASGLARLAVFVVLSMFCKSITSPRGQRECSSEI